MDNFRKLCDFTHGAGYVVGFCLGYMFGHLNPIKVPSLIASRVSPLRTAQELDSFIARYRYVPESADVYGFTRTYHWTPKNALSYYRSRASVYGTYNKNTEMSTPAPYLVPSYHLTARAEREQFIKTMTLWQNMHVPFIVRESLKITPDTCGTCLTVTDGQVAWACRQAPATVHVVCNACAMKQEDRHQCNKCGSQTLLLFMLNTPEEVCELLCEPEEC